MGEPFAVRLKNVTVDIRYTNGTLSGGTFRRVILPLPVLHCRSSGFGARNDTFGLSGSNTGFLLFLISQNFALV